MNRTPSFFPRRKYIFFLVLILVGSPLVWYASILSQFNSIKVHTLKNLPRNMLWAHMGYTKGFPPNSLESFNAAYRMGYYGIELDIHFIDGKGLIIMHDYSTETANDANAIMLESVFSHFGDALYYWVDFKNLGMQNAMKSGELLAKYITSYRLDGHVFVESRRSQALQKLKSVVPQINTIYWISGKKLNSWWGIFREKYHVLTSGADTVSLPVEYADDRFVKHFAHLNKAVFTVNDSDLINHLFQRGIRIILTDIDMRSKFPEAFRSSQR